MEEKRRDAGTLTAAGVDSPASEPASSRRRGGSQKRKAGGAGSSGSSSTPSKRVTRDKSSLAHLPIHNGPLTRARQGPSSLASALAAGGATLSAGATKPAEKSRLSVATAGDAMVALAEEVNKERELQALEAQFEAEFEAIRSRGASAHVAPSHCGWFSWTKIHFIEESTLPSFFNGKSESRTADMYLEIRNWIMKKFHANPSTQIELKDLSELEIGDSDAKQEVMEFLDHWGLINFHPFPPTSSEAEMVAADDGDGAAEKNSLVDKLYHFETLQSSMTVIPKTNITTPAVPSGLFPESAVAEELVRHEGPSVEYHCNSCSADCSRKRYHCQKQADFDLCTDCFNNGKFDSGMSSSDFILMEPAEAPGLSGGKWTDQETLLLLEALELYKENWNEIAEHVATKTKAQCILHFVQMPIEDTFLDCDDDIDANSKEIQDIDSTEKDLSIPKDASEATESKTGVNENHSPSSPMDTSKENMTEVKDGQDSSKQEATNEVKAGQETSKVEDTSEVKVGEETGENCALKALKEAFEAVGYSSTPDAPLSFAEVGNSVMALAIFLARLIGPEVATASAHNSLKSISGNSSGIELATRHCFLLEDPPKGDKDSVDSVVAEVDNRETQKEETQGEESHKEDLLDGSHDKKNEDSTPEAQTISNSAIDGSTENLDSAKEQDAKVSSEEVGPGNLSTSSNSEIPKDQPTSPMRESNGLKSEAELPANSVKESGEGTSAREHSEPTEASKDDSQHSEKNDAQQIAVSNSAREPSHSTEPSKDVDLVSDSLPSENNDPQHRVTSNADREPNQPSETAKDVDMVSNAEHSEKNEPPQSVKSNATVENGESEDQNKDAIKEKQDSTETKDILKIDKIKRAAVSAISAAAVKAKLLANQEEDQIRQLSTLLIEKQLQKLEMKLAFFNDMENVVMRVREQLDRSRQRLYHERAQIIAARLGIPSSSSRAMPPSLPTNRIPMNMANAVPRPPLGTISQRPPMSRPIGPAVPNPSVPLPSTTVSASSIRPPSQDTLSSV
ncbi:SWI/SNF complex subunit SWI3D [Ziziphus jujuba]|uniref:SWI/SNF complex subunit SWI3D n=1 Tax=Ziziphus jujuba TaxID=326968 RepID=A0ABM3IVK2_ZIZJJ|nr:SWI/SNF complex subunit SWI3D [Ziziphus jujuba]